MRRLLSPSPSCSSSPAPARARRARQSLTFEAPARSARSPPSAPARSTRSTRFGVRSLRVILTWQRVAPGRRQVAAPGLRADRSRRLRLGRVRAADGRRQGARLVGAHDDLRARCRSGRRRPSATTSRGRARRRSRRSSTAVGRKFGDQVDTWAIWNEPNQPQFLRPQYARGGQARRRRGSTASSSSPGVRGLRKAGQGDDTILIGETSPRGNRNVVAPLRFLRGVLCLNRSTASARSAAPLPADGYAHHAYTTRQGPYFTPPPEGRRDDRRALAADEGAGPRAPRRRADQAPADLPHRVRHPVHARHAAGRVARSRSSTARSPSGSRGPTRASSAFSQYLLRDSEPTGPNEYGGFESGLRFADGKAKPSLARLPPAARRQAQRLEGLDLGPTCARRPARRPRRSRTPTAARSFKTLRTVKTDSRGYFQVSSTWRKGRRWNLTWEGQSGCPVGAYRSRRSSAQRVGRQARRR